MQFRILGPLEVVENGKPVALRGTKQRATLGFLLLQVNRVVPTSQLLRALWELDDAPTTARKILQNAVHGIRGILSPGSCDAADNFREPRQPVLLTQPPGYMMRLDPEQVDLHQFNRWVAQGREKRAQGASDAAAELLRDALGLWRGPALADLLEAGIEWPELAALENARLDVMEDYFDAQLACGRHYEILPELETMVQAEPLRERSCGQLMLALYRCGRQADALHTYGRVRTELVENLGLEPGRELQALQQSILMQEASLCPEGAGVRIQAPEPTTDGTLRQSVGRSTDTGWESPAGTTVPCRGDGQTTAGRQVEAEPGRRWVGVMAVSTRLASTLGGEARENLDDLLNGATLLVREQIERFGGTVAASIGSVSLAVFGLEDSHEHDASQAVYAALAIRDMLAVSAGPAPLTVRAAVASGEVLLRQYDRDGSPTVIGTVLDDAHSLLAAVPAGEVRVREEVRRATAGTLSYAEADSVSGVWRVTGYREGAGPGRRRTRSVERAYELDVLRELLKCTWHRSTPHLVTVLGETGAGKSKLLQDLGTWASQLPEDPLFLTGLTPSNPHDNSLQAPAQILSAYCGIHAGDGDTVALSTLARKVRSLFHSERTVDWMAARMMPLVSESVRALGVFGDIVSPAETLDAWREFFQEAARHRPIVMGIDDLHRAADFVLDAVEECAESAGPGRLFVVACADPELLRRRPSWAGGKRHTTTVTLDGPERITTERLVESLRAAARSH